MAERTLVVWWNHEIAGRLTQDRHGDLEFSYDDAWLTQSQPQAISRSMPLREEPFDRHICRAFFGGLLPEGDQRRAVADALGISPANAFAMLDRLGGDIAGALTLLPPGEEPPIPGDGAPRALGEAELAALLGELPDRPLLAGEQGLRLSLAGAQAKLPVVLIDGNPALPTPGQATTHIIKPEIRRFPGSVANEYWCMTLASALDLEAAPVEARTAQDLPYLLVTRYDRREDNGKIIRLHQEDACQALGVPAERKYASESGPGFRELFGLTRDYARQPAPDVLQLVDVSIFNMAIGNADAHGKNFSFLLDEKGPRIAPFYDLLATIAWPVLDSRMAMSPGRARTIEELKPDRWKRFADDIGVTWPFLSRRVEELAVRIDALAGDVPDPGGGMIERTAMRAALIRQSLQ